MRAKNDTLVRSDELVKDAANKTGQVLRVILQDKRYQPRDDKGDVEHLGAAQT